MRNNLKLITTETFGDLSCNFYRNMNDDIHEIEIWKDIQDYEGLYQVSNLGKVRSLDRYVKHGNRIIHLKSKLLKFRYDSGKYLRVSLCKDGKQVNFSVHRLVAKHFIPNPDNLPEVNHKDENKENNYVSNLEWCTSKHNTNYGTRTIRASNSAKGKEISKEQRIKLSNSLKGHKTSKETKEKISKALSIPVYQYDLDKNLIRIWKSAQEPKQLGYKFDPTCINKCCRGELKTYKKYIWKRKQ